MFTRIRVGTVLFHLGGVRFPVTGPVRYTTTARQGVELCRLLRPHTAIPVHTDLRCSRVPIGGRASTRGQAARTERENGSRSGEIRSYARGP